jgi:hypothetical protein
MMGIRMPSNDTVLDGDPFAGRTARSPFVPTSSIPPPYDADTIRHVRCRSSVGRAPDGRVATTVNCPSVKSRSDPDGNDTRFNVPRRSM